jgi:phage-related minor tail protein
VIVFQSDFKQETPQPATIDQRNINESKQDSINTVRANILLNQKDSTIKVLNSKLAKEKANTATQKVEAWKQHSINDSLQTKYQKEKDLSTCEDLVLGLKHETVEKDSVIESLDSEIENYSCEVEELEGKVDIQKGVIESKQELIACKDSTITYYKTKQKKTDFWNNVKIKVAGVIIFIETIGLILK